MAIRLGRVSIFASRPRSMRTAWNRNLKPLLNVMAGWPKQSKPNVNLNSGGPPQCAPPPRPGTSPALNRSNARPRPLDVPI
jgi:hypothetical protein